MSFDVNVKSKRKIRFRCEARREGEREQGRGREKEAASEVNTFECVIRSKHIRSICLRAVFILEVSTWFHSSHTMHGQYNNVPSTFSWFYITKPVYVRRKLLNLMWLWWKIHNTENHILPIKELPVAPYLCGAAVVVAQQRQSLSNFYILRDKT